MAGSGVRLQAAAAVSAAALLCGCVTDGAGSGAGGQGLGAVLGGLGGAALGAALGDDEAMLAGALLGAALGAYLGPRIARSLSERDQAAMQAGTAQALTSAADGEASVVTLPESGRRLSITPSETTYDEVDLQVARVAGVEAPPAGFEVINLAYATTADLNLRNAPSTSAARLGVLPEGETVNVLGRLRDSEWMILARGDGAVIGYASGRFLTPTGAVVAATPTIRPIAVAAAPTGIDLDAAAPGGVDLDAGAPMQTAAAPEAVDLDALAATVETARAASACRTVTYNLDDLEETGRICRGADGVWTIA